MQSDNDPLSYYLQEAKKARLALSEILGIEIEAFEFQKALCVCLGIENDPFYILQKPLNKSEMVAIVKDYPFSQSNPEVLCEFIEAPPLIPESVPRVLTERTLRIKGEVWRIHKSDVDPFPSVPHAHNYESGVVLHLGSGEMFDTNRKCIGSIGAKQLTRIRGLLKEKEVPLPSLA